MSETRKKAKWENAGWRCERLVEVETGRIVGEINGVWRAWEARADVLGSRGTYTESHHARKAVELALSITHEVTPDV